MEQPEQSSNIFPKPQKGYKLKFILMSLMVLMLAEAFLLSLGIISFKKNQLAFYSSYMRVYSEDFSESISMALRFGKSLDKFFGMDALMAETAKATGNLANIEIFSTDGVRLNALDPAIPETDITGLGQELTAQLPYYRFRFSIMNGDTVAGTGVFSFDRKWIDQAVSQALTSGLKPIGYSMVVVLLLLIPGLRFFLGQSKDAPPKRRIMAVVFLSVLLCQAVYTYYSVKDQINRYRSMAHAVADDTTRIHLDDIRYLKEKGIALNELNGMDARLKKSVDGLPELAALCITGPDHKVLYQAGDAKEGYDLDHALPGGGMIRAALNQNYILGKVRELVLDSLTVMGLSLLFVTEMTLFLLIYINVHAASDEKKRRHYTIGYIRPAIALYLFGSMLGISFIPIFMNDLTAGKSFMGLSGNLLTSIPVSTEILAALVGSFLAGGWMDRSGWHRPFLTGIGVSICAAVLSSMATSPLAFILFRGLAGLGYGFSWMSAQGFLFNASEGRNLGRGSASLIAGIYSGYICGGAVGGLIADRLGYVAVFRFSGVVLLIPALFTLIFLSSFFEKPQKPAVELRIRDGFAKTRTYLADKAILSILLFSLLPFSLAQMGIFLFATPVVLDALHVSKATTGRVMMIYGVTVIYLGPYLGSLTDRLSNKRMFLVIAGLSGTLGLFLVKYLSGVFALSLALFLMSVAGSIANPAISVLVHARPVTRDVGVGFAVGTQRVFDKLGQMLGPLALGALFSFYTFQISLQILGVFYLIATLCYFLVNRRHA